MKQFLALVFCYLALSGCATDQAAPLPSAAPEIAQTFVYECPDGFSFVARTEAGSAWLFLPGNTVELPLQQSAAATEYSKGGYLFRIEGGLAMIITYEGKHSGCTNNRAKAIWEHAKLNGVDFRALGNEPGWYLEIYNSTDILLVVDYGQNRYRFTDADPRPDPDNRTTVYKARNNGDSIELSISGTACRDSMSGEQFPASVSVLVNGKRYTGCGRALH